MSTSTSQASQASTNLYKGWMTGYAYQVSRDLYFKSVSSPDLSRINDDHGQKLLQWLETYLNLVNDWQATGSHDLMRGLEIMIKNTVNKSHSDVSLAAFDSWYKQLVAAIKGKMPYAIYAADFASSLSKLGHNPTPDTLDELFGNLSQALKKLKNAISQETYKIVYDSIEDLKKIPDKFERREEDGRPKIALYVNKIDPSWSSLILGTKSPSDFLLPWDRVKIGVLFALEGTLLFAVLILPIAISAQLSTNVLPYLTQVGVQKTTLTDLGNVASVLQVLVPVLTAIGLTASVLAKKTWDLLKYLELKGILLFARREILREAKPPEQD